MNIQPWLHVYQKPLAGDSLLRRYPALSYKHRVLANGGFDTASCSLPVSRAEGETIFENYVGNRVAVFVNNPVEPVFEGLVSRITFTTPGVVFTRSLDELGNRTTVSQGVTTGAQPAPQITVNNTASQAIYGIKVKSVRTARRQAAETLSASLAARLLNDIAYPLTSVAVNDGTVSSVIEVELKGFYHTLDWEQALYAGTFALRNGTTGHIDELLNNLANGSTFIDNLDTADLVNNAITHANASDGSTVWNRMQMMAEVGLNAQRWVVGVGPYNPNTAGRRLYYRPANISVEYTARVNQPGTLFTIGGALVQPWTVKPDRLVRITDALVGWDGGGFDPREIYISALEYDGESGKVSWQSDDNIQLAGALQVDKWHTSSDMKYGQRASNPMM